MYQYSYDFVAFASHCHLKVVCPSKQLADSAAGEILKEAKRLESKFSFFLPNSVIGCMNNRDLASVELDSESYSIFEKTLALCKSTNFIFDVAYAGTLKNNNKESDKKFASLSHVKLTENGVIFSNPNTKIDLGGVIKEYAVDICVNILKNYSIDSALIDFGGDIHALGTKNSEKWRIGVKNPKNTAEDIAVIELENQSIATSGHYERAGHILIRDNSEQYIQVSCIADSALEAGVFSTALLVKSSVEVPKHIVAIAVNNELKIDCINRY